MRQDTSNPARENAVYILCVTTKLTTLNEYVRFIFVEEINAVIEQYHIPCFSISYKAKTSLVVQSLLQSLPTLKDSPYQNSLRSLMTISMRMSRALQLLLG